MRFDGAAGQVVPEYGVGERVVGEVAGGGDGPGDLADDRAVAVAVRPGDDPVVDPGELLAAVVQALLGDLAGGRVDDPPVQGHRSVRGPEGRDVEGLVVLAQVDHDLAAVVVVGVEAVEDPARLDLDPADGRAAVARQQPDAGLMRRVPHVRQLLARGDRVQAEGDRQVKQHHVAVGEREVMHHRAVGDRDVGGAGDLSRRVDDDVLDVVPGPEVGDGVQLAGGVVELGVRGEAAGQGPAEVARADGVQLIGQLVRQRPGLDGGQGAPAVGDDVGVGGEVHVLVHRAARPLVVVLRGDGLGADPPVAVPLGLAVAQPHAVHHARA